MDKKELVAGFRLWLEKRERGVKTIKAYLDKVERFSKYLDTHSLGFKDLTAEKVDQYMYFLLAKEKLSAGTRSQTFYALKQFFSYMVKRGELAVNPFDGATRVRKEKRVKGCLTNDEITKMIHAPDLKAEIGIRDTAILAMLTALGTRATALCGLRVGDIKVEEVTIPPKCRHCGQVDYAGQSRLKGSKKPIVIIRVREKGKKEWDIPISDKAAFYLQHYLINRKHNKDSDIVFLCYRRKEPKAINRHGLYDLVRKYAKLAGVNGRVTPHAFRRAAVTWLLDTGVDPIVVKNFFGHESLETTELYRNTTHRSFMWAGVAGEKSLLEAIETPMDALVERLRRD